MKLSEYLLFLALLTPTFVVVAAAVFSFVGPEPEPVYQPPVTMVSSAGLYPGDRVLEHARRRCRHAELVRGG